MRMKTLSIIELATAFRMARALRDLKEVWRWTARIAAYQVEGVPLGPAIDLDPHALYAALVARDGRPVAA
jgi:hypothetical protein